jgi:hypothetical protein
MGAAAMPRLPLVTEPPGRPAQPRLFAIAGGASAAPRTLDDVLTQSWTALASGHAATCAVCSEPMAPRWSAGAGAVGGRCACCGSTLD